MGTILMLLGGICYLVSLVCYIIILIDAFKNEVWKGIVGFFCGLYLLYYAVTEFEHEKKWMIVAGALLGGIVGAGLMVAGGAAAAAH